MPATQLTTKQKANAAAAKLVTEKELLRIARVVHTAHPTDMEAAIRAGVSMVRKAGPGMVNALLWRAMESMIFKAQSGDRTTIKRNLPVASNDEKPPYVIPDNYMKTQAASNEARKNQVWFKWYLPGTDIPIAYATVTDLLKSANYQKSDAAGKRKALETSERRVEFYLRLAAETKKSKKYHDGAKVINCISYSRYLKIQNSSDIQEVGL